MAVVTPDMPELFEEAYERAEGTEALVAGMSSCTISKSVRLYDLANRTSRRQGDRRLRARLARGSMRVTSLYRCS